MARAQLRLGGDAADAGNLIPCTSSTSPRTRARFLTVKTLSADNPALMLLRALR